MKKLATFVFALMVCASLSFAQNTGGDTSKNTTPTTDSGKKTTKTSKAHKGGKKSKKNSGSSTPTTPPK